MNALRLTIAGCALSIFALLGSPARAQTVHAGADTDTKILIGQPGYQHEVIEDHHAGWLYTEANAHSWLPGPSNWAAEAEAHAKRFHLDLPWPIPDLQWTSCWTRNQLRDGYNPKSAKSKASAWGSWFVVDGPLGETAELRARIPANGAVPYDPPPAGIPPQGMYADSFFDVFTELSLAVDPGTGLQDLLAIRSHVGGVASPAPGLTFTKGAWAQPSFTEEEILLPDGSVRKQAWLHEDVLSPTTVFVPTNRPFYVDWLVTVEIPERQFDEELPGEVGAAGALAMQLELVDQSSGRYELRAVPEPGTLAGVLALLITGALARLGRPLMPRKTMRRAV